MASIVGRSTVTAGRFAMGIVRSRPGRVAGALVFAERVTRPVRFGFSATRAYSQMITGNDRNRSQDGPLRRRSASLEYIYKY